ncbi:hypothetical protein WN48_01236 [Eufriesea mexicana]|uniref:Uncharacterized protein n=1 Tax=Eufriesea mexicana TaxID=516756 RepID=A0A310SCX7_9HYME|nr:hypothetical protein WN48_01236 [Eufriesea mexicana]
MKKYIRMLRRETRQERVNARKNRRECKSVEDYVVCESTSDYKELTKNVGIKM